MKKIPESFELDELDIKLAIEYWLKAAPPRLPSDAKCSIILSTSNLASNGTPLSNGVRRISATVIRTLK